MEALVHSASKKDRCSGVIKQATPILKELYQSSNDYIKVRALVVCLIPYLRVCTRIVSYSLFISIGLHLNLLCY